MRPAVPTGGDDMTGTGAGSGNVGACRMLFDLLILLPFSDRFFFVAAVSGVRVRATLLRVKMQLHAEFLPVWRVGWDVC